MKAPFYAVSASSDRFSLSFPCPRVYGLSHYRSWQRKEGHSLPESRCSAIGVFFFAPASAPVSHRMSVDYECRERHGPERESVHLTPVGQMMKRFNHSLGEVTMSLEINPFTLAFLPVYLSSFFLLKYSFRRAMLQLEFGESNPDESQSEQSITETRKAASCACSSETLKSTQIADRLRPDAPSRTQTFFGKVLNKDYERQKCKRHQCEANTRQQCECQQCKRVTSANETRVPNVRMSSLRYDIGAKKSTTVRTSTFFFSKFLILIPDLDETKKRKGDDMSRSN